jgi:serine/threonine protein kinase
MNQRQHELLQREIAVMSKLHHPSIVDLVEAFDTPKKTYLVLE